MFPSFEEKKKRNDFDPMRAAHLAIINVLLLAECRLFLGTFSSNMSRAAFELLVVNFGPQSLGISLDIQLSERVN